MRILRSKSIVVLLALTLILAFASTAAAAPADSSAKTGFYVYDADKIGQEYRYYSMPYVLDPANFVAFLDYKDAFADNSKFIWVNSSEQFVSMENWENGPADITNIINDLGSATYYDVENATTISLALGFEATVAAPSKAEFSLTLSRAIADLTSSDLILKDSSESSVTITAITNPAGDNTVFEVACDLIPGETYTLGITKAGFALNETITFDVPTEAIIVASPAITGQSKTGFTLNLSTPLDGITFDGNFKLHDQYGNEIAITSATSSDGGETYDFATGTLIRERTYTLTSINDRYSLSPAVSFVIPPLEVTATIKNVTVNDLVVELNPGVSDIPSANFYLLDGNNSRLLTMVLTKSGTPTTQYKIGAFPYLVAGADYSIRISMPEYTFGEATSISPGQENITMAVSDTVLTTGFAVTMDSAVPGLTAANFSLKNAQNATVPFAVSTTDGGATYIFKTDLIAGSNYKISAVKNGFSFGTAKEVVAPVIMVGGGAVNGSVYVYLNGVLETLPAASAFTITRSIDGVAQPNVTATNVSQNTTTRMLNLTVPAVAATDADQVVTGTVKYGDVTKNYTFTVGSSPVPVAAGIISITAPAQDVKTLTLPTVPTGFSIAIKSSSNEAVIKTDGTIVPPASDTTVNLVLVVTQTKGGATADTVSIPVIVPGSPTAVAASLTIANPAVGATTLTLPTVPDGYSVEIVSSDNTDVIALDGAITAPLAETTVGVVLEVTKTSNGTKANTSSIDVVVPAMVQVKVTKITVSGADGATTISTNKGSLQMLAAITPSNASNKSVTWSVNNGTGAATISADGLLTAKENGAVTVKATAKDGSGVSGELVITISEQLAEITLADLNQSGVTVDESLIVFNGPYGLIITLESLQSQFPNANMDSTVTITIEGTAYPVPKNALGDANFVGEIPYTLTTNQIIVGVINVVIPKSTAKDITAFSFTTPVANGTIDGTNIAVTVPYGTNVKSLVATFSHSKLSTVAVGDIAQVSGTSTNNFSSPVTYVVTAEDGSIKTYTVTITVSMPTLTQLGTEGITIDNSLVVFNGPYGLIITLAALQTAFPNANMDSTVTITIEGTAYPIPKNALGDANFVGEIPYTLTTNQINDGLISVVTPKSTAKDITSFSFANPAVTGTIDGTGILVTVPFRTDVTGLVATYTNSNLSTVKVGSITQLSGSTINSFSNPVIYVVTAEDGSTKTYTVTVVVESPTLTQLGTEGITVDNSLVVFNGPYGLIITLEALQTAYPDATMDSIVKITIEGTTYDVPKNALGDDNFVGEIPYTLTNEQINSGRVTVQ